MAGQSREGRLEWVPAASGMLEVLAHIKASSDFLLQSCGAVAVSLQMFKGQKQEEEGEGWGSESPFSAAFMAVNGIAHGVLVVHVNLFRWWLQLKGRAAASSPL